MKPNKTLLLLALCLGAPSVASASLMVGATRVIYHQQDAEATVRVGNEGTAPLLLQTWIDEGDAAASLETLDAPFAVTPSMERMEPGSTAWVRIRKVAGELPQDRESIYYLNLLSVPPQPEVSGEDAAQLQFAVRSRLKLIYRPDDLSAAAAAQAADRVSWQLQCEHGRQVLLGSNPTPFHISYTQVALRAGAALHTQGRSANGGGGMILPLSTRLFPLGDVDCNSAGDLSVEAEWMNDFGGRIQQERQLER